MLHILMEIKFLNVTVNVNGRKGGREVKEGRKLIKGKEMKERKQRSAGKR